MELRGRVLWLIWLFPFSPPGKIKKVGNRRFAVAETLVERYISSIVVKCTGFVFLLFYAFGNRLLCVLCRIFAVRAPCLIAANDHLVKAVLCCQFVQKI